MKEYFWMGYRKLRDHGLGAVMCDALIFLPAGILAHITSPFTTKDGVICDPSDELSFVTQGRFYLGQSERPEKELIERIDFNDLDLVELGGGIGYLSAFMNRRLSKRSRHFVLEANPQLIPALKRMKELNGAHYEILNRAYSSHESVDFPISTLYKYSSLYRDGAETVEVPGIDLKNLVKRYELEAFVLYCDIEGAEKELIENEIELIRTHCPVVLIEFHDSLYDSGSTAEELKESLSRVGYERNEHGSACLFIRSS